MENQIKDRRIKREEVSTLLWSMGGDISTHSLSMWIKSKTNDEWVVVPRNFCISVCAFLEKERAIMFEEGVLNKKQYSVHGNYLKQIENYL